jgi:hypothetical protein
VLNRARPFDSVARISLQDSIHDPGSTVEASRNASLEIRKVPARDVSLPQKESRSWDTS